MKRKLGISLILFFVFLGIIRGQNWFLDSSYVWTEKQPGFGSSVTKRYTFDSSLIIINGKQYYEKLVSTAPSGNNWSPTQTFYRTDDFGKVYLYSLGKEEMIYDYSLNVNDSFLIPYGFGTYLIVDLIDTIQLENGERRKQLAMRCSNEGFIANYWIEGLGGINGVYGRYIEECLKDALIPTTLCISRNDTLLYENSDYDSCWYVPVSTENITNDFISIYPNPASTEILIDPKAYQIQKVSVIDLLGNVISMENKPEVDISFLLPGYYFLRIELEYHQVVMKRFVKI